MLFDLGNVFSKFQSYIYKVLRLFLGVNVKVYMNDDSLFLKHYFQHK